MAHHGSNFNVPMSPGGNASSAKNTLTPGLPQQRYAQRPFTGAQHAATGHEQQHMRQHDPPFQNMPPPPPPPPLHEGFTEGAQDLDAPPTCISFRNVPPKQFNVKPVPTNQKLLQLTSCFHCSENEEFAKLVFERMIQFDRALYRSVLNDKVIKCLESDKQLLSQQREELLKENQRLKEERGAMTGMIDTLRKQVTRGQKAASTLKSQLLDRDKQLKILNQKLTEMSEQVEASAEKMEKQELQKKVQEETIQILEEQQKKLKETEIYFKNQTKKNKEKVAELSASNSALQAQVQEFKKTVRNREGEIDSLGMEVKVLEEEAAAWKEERDALKECVAKLEASKMHEVQMRKRLEVMCPDMINTTLEKSTREIISLMEKRKRPRHDFTPVASAAQGVVPAENPAVDKKDEEPQNGECNGGGGGGSTKRNKRESEKNLDKKSPGKRKGEGATSGVTEEIWITDNSEEDEVNLKEDKRDRGRKMQAVPVRKMAVAKWKLLQQQQSAGLKSVAGAGATSQNQDHARAQAHSKRGNAFNS